MRGFCLRPNFGAMAIAAIVTLAAVMGGLSMVSQQQYAPPHYVVQVNAYGVPIFCWQAVDTRDILRNGTFALDDGTTVYTYHGNMLLISANPEAVGIDPDRCADGRYNVIGSTAAALR